MATKSRFIKPVSRPLTQDEMRSDANRLINARVRGWMDGRERREQARAHADPAVRAAAQFLDEYDAARPQSVIEAQAARQAGDATTPSVDPAKVDPVASPARRPLMQPSVRIHGADGKFLSPKFTKRWEPVRRLLQDLRESGKGGVA